jgi:hypothetical protein
MKSGHFAAALLEVIATRKFTPQKCEGNDRLPQAKLFYAVESGASGHRP